MRRFLTALVAFTAALVIPVPAHAATLVFQDDFAGTRINTRVWGVYDGVNPASGERWSARAWTASGGILTGSSGGGSRVIPGIAMTTNQRYGDWQVRARFPATQSRKLNPVFLLWPQNDTDWPAAGEVDFTENYDPTRQSTQGWLHYGPSNRQTYGYTRVDMTQWHVYEVRWTATAITYLIDGHSWFTDTNTSHLPPGPMHLTVQMDDTEPALPHPYAEFQIDWVRVYR